MGERQLALIAIRIALFFLLAWLFAACRSAEPEISLDVTVVVDGREETYNFAYNLTVDQLLASAQIELGPRDRPSHPLVSSVTDGMRLTIRRVQEKQVCQEQEIAYQRLLLPREGIPAGQQRLGQVGAPGLEEACYRLILEDGEEVERALIDTPIILRQALDEIIYIAPSQETDALALVGRLSYINHGQAWTITGNASDKRPLTTGHNLDSLVFQQREDGAWLLFTSEIDASDDFFNELWLVATAGEGAPVRLTPTDVLYAEWRPRRRNAIAYSTGEPASNGWQALNNLWLMSIDLETGRALSIEGVLAETRGGLYGWWGTHFAWSPDGERLAWARVDGFGLVDLEGKRLQPLVEYAVFHSATDWVWLSPLSWSQDSLLIASVAHGAPIGGEPAENSPIFDALVTDAAGRFSAALSPAAGMWAAPTFSPNSAPPGSTDSDGYIAWLQARRPQDSMNGEYDLILADRDGSNQRRLFPPAGAPGMQKNDFGLTAQDFVWSPDARAIALIYLGDVWLIDVETATAQQITFDGGSSNPVWTR